MDWFLYDRDLRHEILSTFLLLYDFLESKWYFERCLANLTYDKIYFTATFLDILGCYRNRLQISLLILSELSESTSGCPEIIKKPKVLWWFHGEEIN